nr:RNA-directed DNA polymerase, eukaryota, reverse transcriptase zinc-binding domain protein [Tanacetum cinerariifolium]
MGINVGDEKAQKWEKTCLGCKLGRRLSISVLASKEKGGIGVSSLYALNRALMMKWVWRLENSLRRSIRGVEQVQFNELTDVLQSVSLMPYSDGWVWSLEGSGEFSVASISTA